MRITDAMGSKGTYQHGETNQDIIVNIHMREEDLHWQVYPGNVTLHSVTKTKKLHNVKWNMVMEQGNLKKGRNNW